MAPFAATAMPVARGLPAPSEYSVIFPAAVMRPDTIMNGNEEPARQPEFFDLSRGGDPADTIGVAFREPQRIVDAERDAVRLRAFASANRVNASFVVRRPIALV